MNAEKKLKTKREKSRQNKGKKDNNRRSNSLIFLNQNIYVMNVNFSSLEYLWSLISTAGAVVAHNTYKRKGTQCWF